jgi:transposase
MSQRRAVVQQGSTVVASRRGASKGLTLGLDLGDRVTHCALLDAQGRVTERGKVATTREALREQFAALPPSRVVLEVSTHSPWVSALFGQLGHDVIVANARAVRAVSSNPRKSDRVDAELLARLGRVDPELLRPIEHRGEAAQRDLTVLRARDTLVRARAMLINSARGLVKASGARLPPCDADAFHRHAPRAVPDELRSALEPLLEACATLTQQIRAYDREVEAMLVRHPVTQALRQLRGVGPLTSLAYVLIIDDPRRFARSRMVGPYLGLVPRRRQSGDRDPELHITKTGDRFLRKLLVESAQYMLGPFGEDSDLRRWGLQLAGEGSTARKRRAVVAVARKLAALLHHLWVNGDVYEPLRQAA